MLSKRQFLATGAAALIATPALAAPIPLNTLSAYLNQMRTAEAEFTQINPDGTIATGRIYIQRPGRVRFDYNPPEQTLVMAGGGQVAVFDGKSNTNRPEQYPLARTPLKIILERNVNLAQRNMVVGHRQDGVKTIVVAQDPAHPEYGRIELVFTAAPTQLRQWVIVDGQGQRTTVVLGDLKTGGNFPSRYFSIQQEITRRG
ncbi:outer membrane lipoprotein carrier protein LolA [Maribius pontilimi]|uniref:Outer membrane lipoprotein carrier protein LolA n=1 Tax=Palleronia pontilimi TaxID=1964209 RepID=A0A934IGT5_9RHOB|nr:outer membrane lipoprotein carrier protein LolA [Palleronia pontilimi]MBJ3763135.1 outer membrane lipoprotein carrier protein LolA [Palleronia pontilimi]